MNNATGSVQVTASPTAALRTPIPHPREAVDTVPESNSRAERLGQRLVDRKLEELRRATQDAEPAANA